jgi:hypothetical protein
MLHTVRVSNTMTSMLLTRAGVGEGRSGRTKGNVGGSTSASHLEPERCKGLGVRRSVMGGPARSCHLLARSSAPRRSSIGGRASRMERLSVRQLGTPAGSGQGPLNPGDPIGGSERAPALRTQQRHPQGDPLASSTSRRPRNSGRVQVRLRPLTREGETFRRLCRNRPEEGGHGGGDPGAGPRSPNPQPGALRRRLRRPHPSGLPPGSSGRPR